jgi:2'-5' RNA ligase
MAVGKFCEHTEERAFHPHLTIGRIRPGGRKSARDLGAKLQAESIAIEAAWTVSELILFRSELTPKGAIHIPLASIRW